MPLDQHGVVVRGDDRAGESISTVEADAVSTGGAVHLDLACVGLEALRGVLAVVIQALGWQSRGLRSCPGSEPSWAQRRARSNLDLGGGTISMPVISSVMVCSTWMRGLISMK